MGLDLRVEALVRAADDRVALLDLRVDPPVAAGPVRVLAEEADPPGDEDPHGGRLGAHDVGSRGSRPEPEGAIRLRVSTTSFAPA